MGKEGSFAEETHFAHEDDVKPRRTVKEKFLLFKIDLFVLSFVCLQYWINYVDRIAFVNAYISGMKEDLNFQANDINIANMCFTIGYIVSMIPNNLILLIVSPRIWLSFCTLAWGVLTLSLFKISSFKQCCAIRFFQAIFESCTFSGTHLILGSWYKENELATRSAIFTSSGLVGSMFSGFMQVQIHKSLNGKASLAGWRWLFIIDACLTLPIAIYGFIFFPGMPEIDSDKAKFSMTKVIFSSDELKYARRRLPVRDESTKLDWSVIPRVFKRWHWWLFSLVWILGGENLSLVSNSTFALWLTNQDYSLSNRNNFPSGIFAVGIVSTIGSALYLSYWRRAKHWHVAVILAVVMCVVAIMIRVRPLNAGIMFTAQYLGGIAYAGQAVFFAWANVECHQDLQERAIVLASMNMFSGAVNAWWSIVFFPATTTPYFQKGSYALLATAIASAVVSIVIRKFQIRDSLQKQVLPYIDANDMLDDDEDAADSDNDNYNDDDNGNDNYNSDRSGNIPRNSPTLTD